MERLIYTVGSGIRTLEEFLELLRIYEVSLLADVRRFPKSRFPWFQQKSLAGSLARAGITYLYFGDELGGYRRGGYERHMRSDEFRRGLERLSEAADRMTTAVMCSEKLPWKCHRRFIGSELERQGWKVRHILAKGEVWKPSRQMFFPGKFL